MESENGDPRSPRGGPVLEPTTQELQPAGRWDPSRAAQPAGAAGEPFTGAGLPDDATEWLAEESDQSVGGEALAAGRDGGTRTPRFRQVNVQLRADTFDVVTGLQHASGMAKSHFLSLALLLGAAEVAKIMRPLGVPPLRVR